ncbi:aldose 1-epimerase family protein [Novosphingobium sp. FSY-8]|uniref:Aldose 1-epimerase family protein n=1 Tax=Novosphingobium ovatum TaxID=1908523 RepID=A0ABW9XGT3_9SPHN|nr:aldose 1-epimerase family protein [Novosphingobium ovatum]NBC37711.1 aldose 1-epimerase family protein [Novosphingobium ovatum]
MTDNWLTISSGALTARINPFGAELSSLTDAAGAEYMTDADPAFWTGRAPVLFPIVGGLAGDRYRLAGADYALAKHGFARRSAFDVVAHDAARAVLRLTDTAETRAAYPFAFALEMAFALEGATLRMAATVRNTGDGVMPFSFGYHPAFAWPLPGAEGRPHTIRFAAEEPQDIRRLDSVGLLQGAGQPTPVVGRDLALDPALFDADALIWTGVNSRALTYGAGEVALDIAFPDTPDLGIWQKPGARYICIEPWAGYADPVGHDGDLAAKPGIILLPPGQGRTFRMDVALRAG